MLSTKKRILDNSHDNIDCKRKNGYGYRLSDKFWILKHFEQCDGGKILADEILEMYSRDHSQDKENTGKAPDELSRTCLGRILGDLWLGVVHKVKLGKRGQLRKYYVNICKKPQTTSTAEKCSTEEVYTSDFNSLMKKLDLPSNWMKVQNSLTSFSIFRCEKWSMNGVRVFTDITIEREEQDSHSRFKIKISSQGGAVIDNILRTDIGSEIIELKLEDQIKLIVQFLDSPQIGLCNGLRYPDSPITTHKAHRIEEVIYLNSSCPSEKRVFSTTCSIFALPGQCCTDCSEFNKIENKTQSRRKSADDYIHPFCNDRWLTPQQLKEKMNKIKRNLCSVKQKNKHFEDQLIQMEESDSLDLESIMTKVSMNDIPPNMATLWQQQVDVMKTDSKHGRRWHPKIIQMCLELYCKNPHVLDTMREVLYLPSNKTIRFHKNKREEKPGWQPETVLWCLQKAQESKLEECDYWGGLVLDEMKIQENVEMTIKKNKKGILEHRLVGFAQLGTLHEDMRNLEGKKDVELASHVLQFMFLSDCGFKFPVAQFPSHDLTPTDLYDLFWNGVLMLLEHNFTIYWRILDGADVNRTFIKLHFPSRDPVPHNFTAMNVFTGEPMIFMMDPKHNIKKIRNNIEKSNSSVKPRCLMKAFSDERVKKIMWTQLLNAYNFDQNQTTIHIHERLTEQHFHLDAATKMRNHLAEDVLDKKMLYLMKAYQRHLIACGKDGSDLDFCIQLLEHTSKLIEMFSTSRQCLQAVNDNRMRQLDSFLKWLTEWKQSCEDSRNFISSKLWFDLQSMVYGFKAIVQTKLSRFPNAVVKAWITNQDVVENHFCNVRACNGQNNNPSFKLQASTQNSIRIGQTTKSTKCNALIK